LQSDVLQTAKQQRAIRKIACTKPNREFARKIASRSSFNAGS
jgi:hypothetical protein